jgi:LETM1 and EF-hand domain-containing protein 1
VLPDTTTEEAKVKILEVSGDRVDNKSKLEVIRMEEEIIQREKEELRKEEEAEKKLLKVKEAVATATPLESAAQPSHVTSPVEELTDKAPILAETEAEKIEHIDTEDLSKIEDLLEHVAASKRELRVEVEELKALKEDITEYQENLEGVKGVVQSSGGTLSSMTESKAAQRLSRKVNKMIAQMDEVVTDLTSRKEALIGDINAKKGTVAARSATADGEDVTRKQILEEISEEQHNLITINELLESIQKLKKVSDSKKFEIIARVLDEDKDGVIDFTDAMKVIELLGKENIKLSAEQMVEIMSVLRKEKEILEAEKLLRKQQQQQQQPNTVTEPSPKTDSKSM